MNNKYLTNILGILGKANQAKNEQTVNQVSDTLINLRNAVNKKKIPENENSDEVMNIVKKSLILINSKNVKDSKY